MNRNRRTGWAVRTTLAPAVAAAALAALASGAAIAAEPPLVLARDGFFYVNGKPTTVNHATRLRAVAGD
jgi:hypothetical protein